MKAVVCSWNTFLNGVSRTVVSRVVNLYSYLHWRGPLATRVRMLDQCARTTSSSSVDRLSAKGSRAGGSMGSASVTSGWWGVVGSLIDLIGDGDFVTSVHRVRTCLVRAQRLVNFCPHFAHVYTVVCLLLLLLLLLLLRRHTDLTCCCRSSHLSNVASHLHEYFVRFA